VITERLLQFIWQYQYYNSHDLKTVSGDPVSIIRPGTYNSDQGPDFLNARVRMSGQVWAGNIELHLSSGDWFRHTHDRDPYYSNVILHVVWSDDGIHPAGIPMLVIEDRVSVLLLDQYRQWMSGLSFIPCGNSITRVPDLIMLNWKDRLILERLERKSSQIFALLAANHYHWDEVLWWMLARNFGLRVNADAFEAVARSIPYNVLMRHRNQLTQVEALLLGQARLLENPGSGNEIKIQHDKTGHNKLVYAGKAGERYEEKLIKEYAFLSRKYGLKPILLPMQFLRMRPPSFPPLRLAELAMFIHRQADPLKTILHGSLKEILGIFEIEINGYWATHYRPGRSAGRRIRGAGPSLAHSLIINTVLPFLYAHLKHFAKRKMDFSPSEWLDQIGAEKNLITAGFEVIGMKVSTAADSQFLLELKSRYCSQWNCLDCAIGNHLLKSVR